MTNHDAIFKLIFGNKRVLASLLRAYWTYMRLSKDWTDAMDLRTLIQLSPQHTSEDSVERRGDMVWYVKQRKRPNIPPGRGVLIIPEMQSYDDKDMCIRLIGYGNMTQQELDEDTYVIDGKRPPEILILVYNGERPWKRSTRSADAYYPFGDTPVAEVLGSLNYFVLDIGALAGQDLPENEPMTCLVRQQNAKTVQEVWNALTEAFQMIKGRRLDDRRARRGFYEHARSLPLIREDGNFPSYESLEDNLLREGSDMATVAEANAERWFSEVRGEGREEGLEKGREEGREEGLEKGREKAEEEAARIFTADMFGDDTAAMLVEHFRAADDPKRLAKVSGWIRTCRTGDELLARARQEWGSGRKARGPSRVKNSRKRS